MYLLFFYSNLSANFSANAATPRNNRKETLTGAGVKGAVADCSTTAKVTDRPDASVRVNCPFCSLYDAAGAYSPCATRLELYPTVNRPTPSPNTHNVTANAVKNADTFRILSPF